MRVCHKSMTHPLHLSSRSSPLREEEETALSIVFTTPSVPLIGDRNGAQTASLYGWRTIRGLRQQRSCGFLCGMNRRDTMQDDYGDALLGLLLMGAQGPDNVQHN